MDLLLLLIIEDLSILQAEEATKNPELHCHSVKVTQILAAVFILLIVLGLVLIVLG